MRKKKLFLLFLFFSYFVGCHHNPVSKSDNEPEIIRLTTEEEDVITKIPFSNLSDTAKINKRIKANSIEALLLDTVPKESIISDNVPLAKLRFWLDLRKYHIVEEQTLAKALASAIKNLADFRRNHISVMTLQFAPLDPNGDTINISLKVVNGVCSTKVVLIPSGYRYEVLISLWRILKYPWNKSSYLHDRSFSAIDTIDLIENKTDTLKMMFYESLKIKYFLGIEEPPGNWTEDKIYRARIGSASQTVLALYKNDSIFCTYLSDIANEDMAELSILCDTGTIILAFYPDLTTMIDDGMVEVNDAFEIIHPPLSMDDAPTHVRDPRTEE